MSILFVKFFLYIGRRDKLLIDIRLKPEEPED